MYTINGAYVMRQEGKTGSLVVGKEADFIVLDRNIFDLAENNQLKNIKSTKVLQTILAGEEVWRSKYFKKYLKN
jgi:predicted amidohydrolase YtcJ